MNGPKGMSTQLTKNVKNFHAICVITRPFTSISLTIMSKESTKESNGFIVANVITNLMIQVIWNELVNWYICKSSPASPVNSVTTKHSWQLIWIGMSKRYICELRPTPATSVIIKPQPLRHWEYTWTTSTMLILSPMTVVIVGKSSKLNTTLDVMPSQYTRWNWGHDRSMVHLQMKSHLAF